MMVKYTDKIEQFLDGEMTAEQEAAFKELIKTDPDLAREIEAHLLATEGIQYFQGLSSLKVVGSEAVVEEPKTQELEVVENQPQPKTSPVTPQPERPGILRRMRPIIGLAAAIVLLIYIFRPNEHYVLDVTEMSSAEPTLQQAQDTYNTKDYEAAIPLLEKFPENIPVQIAKAYAHYNLGEFETAVVTLQPIASGNSGHKSDANWYLALTYLKQDQAEKAKAALKEIKSGEYYDKAQRLLKKKKWN